MRRSTRLRFRSGSCPAPRPAPRRQGPRRTTMPSAGRTVRGNNRPMPITTWINAKNVFHSAMWGSMKWPMFVMTHETTAGWPLALGRMNVSTKSRLNMKGWNCSAASRTQKSPSTIWSTLCVPMGRQNRCAIRSGPCVVCRHVDVSFGVVLAHCDGPPFGSSNRSTLHGLRGGDSTGWCDRPAS